MSDGAAHKHDWGTIVSVGLAIAIAYAGVVSSWVVLSERTQTTINVVTDHEQRLRKMESDRALEASIYELRMQIAKLDSQVSQLRTELSARRSRER